ncbi:hypothetical protein PG988_015089 [Apiospora saccharicola]
MGLHSRYLSIADHPTIPMSGGNLIPGSDDWQHHAHDEVFGPHSILPYYYYGLGLGGSGIPTPGQFTIPSQLVHTQESAGGYGYPVHQGLGWDCAAQSSQHGQLAQPFAQPQTEVYEGNLTTTHDGLPPETPTSSEASPSHEIVPAKSSKEKNRVAAAKCRQRVKEENNALLAKVDALRGENEALEDELRGLKEATRSLTLEVLKHNQCGDNNIQRFIQSRAYKVAGGGGGC